MTDKTKEIDFTQISKCKGTKVTLPLYECNGSDILLFRLTNNLSQLAMASILRVNINKIKILERKNLKVKLKSPMNVLLNLLIKYPDTLGRLYKVEKLESENEND